MIHERSLERGGENYATVICVFPPRLVFWGQTNGMRWVIPLWVEKTRSHPR